MEYRNHYDEIIEHFGEGRPKDAGAIQKDLQLHDVSITSYYTDKYALWLDFRTIDDNKLDGPGRRLENTLEGIRLLITKKAGSEGKLSCYYIVSIPGIYSRMIKLTFQMLSFKMLSINM